MIKCINCGDEAHFKCGTCHSAYYCSSQCAQQDKPEHIAHDCYNAHEPDVDDIFERIQLCLPEQMEDYDEFDHLGNKYLDALEQYPECPHIMASAQSYLHDHYACIGLFDEEYVNIAKKTRRARLKAKRMKKKLKRKRKLKKAKKDSESSKRSFDKAKGFEAQREDTNRLRFFKRRRLRKKANEARGKGFRKQDDAIRRRGDAGKINKKEKELKDEQTRLTKKKNFDRDLKKQEKQTKKANRYADKAQGALDKGKKKNAMRYAKKGKKTLGITNCLTCDSALSQTTYIGCNDCEKVHYCSIACANDDYERHDPLCFDHTQLNRDELNELISGLLEEEGEDSIASAPRDYQLEWVGAKLTALEKLERAQNRQEVAQARYNRARALVERTKKRLLRRQAREARRLKRLQAAQKKTQNAQQVVIKEQRAQQAYAGALI